MQRRRFIALLGCAAAWLGVARAQEPRKIGFLCLGNPDPTPFLKALTTGLHDLGYLEGKDIRLEVRSAVGSAAKLASLAADLVTSKVAVIVAFQTPAATAAKAATGDIPIVMYVADPVRQGLAKSISKPGGNLTGVDPLAETLQKNLELMREIFPAIQRVAVLANASDPFHEPFLEQIGVAADALKVAIEPVMVHSADELDGVFADITKWRAEAVLVQPSITQKRIADLALEHHMLAIGAPAFVELGALASYTADPEALYRRCADFVDKILKGAKPTDLPIELPTKFWLAVNLRTARTLGIKMPQTILARADQVIE
jgi:putative tryptophan/tyrosine transport system substrate-binding protein